MKIGILVLSVGPFGCKGFYNLQEAGLAKALDRYCDEVKVYKSVLKTEKTMIEPIIGTEHATIQYLPCETIGINGMPDLKKIDVSLDLLVCFSDTQLMLPKVFRWSKKHKVRFLPYIGVVESHSTNRLYARIMDVLLIRNLMIYRNCICLAKTPEVVNQLFKRDVKNVILAPVGLDLSIVKTDFKNHSKDELKKKYGFKVTDQVILFVGRLVDEKRPVEMIHIFSRLHKCDSRYQLLMVGSGELLKEVQETIKHEKITDAVQRIEKVPNETMWEIYRISDSLINLNKKEIFGMAIMEAMYYGCKVIAWKAPGPDWIIENEVSGYLVSDEEELLQRILEGRDLTSNAHMRVKEQLTWDHTAKKIMQILWEPMDGRVKENPRCEE